LVCTKWNQPAKTALFSNTIVYGTKEKALDLHGQLLIDPSKGKLIELVYFKEDFYTFWVVEDVFNTNFLPNASSFEGSVSRPLEFHEILLKIDCDSSNVLKKLEVLPMYYGHPNQRYFDVLLAFRETSSEITISHYYSFLNRTTKEFADDLNTFTNLKSIELYTAFRELLELELL